MKKKLINTLLGRTARNIYLWALIIYWRVDYFDFQYSSREFGLMLLLLCPFLALLYTNNLLLVPRFIVRKKYLSYVFSMLMSVFASAFLSTLIIKTALQYDSALILKKVIWTAIDPQVIERDINFALINVVHFLFFTIATIIFTLCWYVIDYQKKQAELAEIKEHQAATELSFLRNQLNPHFLFNTLNNLYGLALRQAGDTADAILKLSLILRYILYEANAQLVSFDKEKEIMQAYIELELLRLTNTDNLNFIITADAAYQLPPLLWLPVLENMFKHGTRYINNGILIEFNCTIQQNIMYIHAKNSFKPDNLPVDNVGGIGLSNLRKRLALIYPHRHQVTIKTEDNFYTIDIKIELA